jgi:hypothetical protein
MAKVSHNYPFWTIFGVAKHMAKNHTLGLTTSAMKNHCYYEFLFDAYKIKT